MTTKYIFVTGGVASSLGKGVLAASVGLLLERRGLSVAIQKIDPYLNIDPGTMNPCQHGEVYVLSDGTETDLDLGHYERFCAARLSRSSSTTMGRIYQRVLNRERKGEYLGQTVQTVPHVVREVREAIARAGCDPVDVVITEVGGTVGDIEGLPVLEAVRQMVGYVGHENAVVIHMTLLPYIAAAGELKTKPTQHSVMELRRVGLRPDLLVGRYAPDAVGLDDANRKKLALFCDVPVECVFGLADHNPVYNVPLELYDSGFNTAICKRLGLCDETPDAPCGVADLSDWREYVARSRGRHSLPRVQIALVAKYQHADAYKSVLEALEHAGLSVGVRVDVTVCDAEMFDGSEKDAETLREFDGVLVPGGFGARGVAGKIAACRAARENDIPYFGICLGLQIAVIEAARNLCGYADADSTEFAPDTEHPVVAILENQKGVSNKGGTMRLGNCPTRPIMGTRLAEAYCTELGESVTERHRHRFEINGAYLEDLYRVGMCLCATGRDGLAEAMERVGHPWFIGVQYHPEFNSRPTAPHPLFVAFVRAGKKRADGRPPAAPSNREFVIRVRQNEMRVVSGKVPEGSIFAGLQGDSK